MASHKERAERVRKKKLAIKAKRPVSLSDIDQDVANEKELGLRVSQNAARLGEKLASRRSGKVYTSPRRDPFADRDIFLEIQGTLERQGIVRLARRTGPGVISRRIPVHLNEWDDIKKADNSLRRRLKPDERWTKTILAPGWDHTGDMLKGLAWAMVMFERQGRAMTLRLGPEVITAARLHPKGFAQFMRRRIKAYLDKAMKPFGLPSSEFFFAVEDTEFGEVHLHGAILAPADPGAFKAMRKALKRAGGVWRSKDTGRQLDTPELYSPVRWVNYIAKWRLGSALNLDSKVSAATQGVRRMAQVWYRQARASGAAIDPLTAYQRDKNLLAI